MVGGRFQERAIVHRDAALRSADRARLRAARLHNLGRPDQARVHERSADLQEDAAVRAERLRLLCFVKTNSP